MDELELITDSIKIAKNVRSKQLLSNLKQLEEAYVKCLNKLNEKDSYINQLENRLNSASNTYRRYTGYDNSDMEDEVRSLKQAQAEEEGYSSYDEYEAAMQDEIEREQDY